MSREQQILLEIDNATVIMARCDACGATRIGATITTPIEREFDVEGGTYVFMVMKQDVTRPTSVTLSEGND